MKKIYFLFITLLLFSNSFTVNKIKKAKNPPPYIADISKHKDNYNNYMEAYYDNLKENYGYNQMGSCGYVALSILLSYYDNYLSDDIIDERYDVAARLDVNDFITKRCSPGTNNEIAYNYKNFNTYYNYILNTKSKVFHTYLISLGIDLGIHKKNVDDYGTTFNDRLKVLKKYLTNKNIDYKIESKEKNAFANNVKSFVIENVKKGNPVLVGIENSEEAHAVIAYEYDEINDKIYCHFGDKMRTRSTIEDSEFPTYENALVLKINKNHVHTENYIVDGKVYCYCNPHIKVYKELSHNYEYTSIDSSNHNIYCECGLDYIDKHNFKRSSIDGKIKSTCTLCGFTISSDDLNIISEGH